MQTAQAQHREEVQTHFKQVEKREQANMSQVQTAMVQLRTSIEEGFANTMQKHGQAIDHQFQDFKSMFATSLKRGAPKDADDMES